MHRGIWQFVWTFYERDLGIAFHLSGSLVTFNLTAPSGAHGFADTVRKFEALAGIRLACASN